ncbi:MAG: FliG C-terminal domain-containing protein [Planctomycetota bacterium]|jgi:flagellar motor switch protein FliG
MAISGKRKAALLLMSLDAATAMELLKGLPHQDVQEIALELAEIERSSLNVEGEQEKIVADFRNSIKGKGSKFSIRGFLREMLVNIVGEDKAQEIQTQIRELTSKKDPFAAIRMASPDELFLALNGKGPQTIAVVLSELESKASQEILGMLDEEVQTRTVCKMTMLDQVRPEVRRRIAVTVGEQLDSFKGIILPEKREQSLRKLAIMLGGLDTEIRDRLLEEIGSQDEETCNTVRNLMVTWEDILAIGDRSLQEILRTVDVSKLAMALHNADERIVEKIKANISERAAETLEEETSLMQEPMEEDILEAREEIVKPLREANEQGKLRISKRQR